MLFYLLWLRDIKTILSNSSDRKDDQERWREEQVRLRKRKKKVKDIYILYAMRYALCALRYFVMANFFMDASCDYCRPDI